MKAYETGNLYTNYYDSKDNLLKQEFADGTSISHSYDSHNKRIISVNERGIETRYNYNSMGLLTKVTEAGNTADRTVTRHYYDDNGNRISTSVYDGETPISTDYIYDDKDNLTGIFYPNGGTRSLSYDFMGNMVEDTNPVGLVTTMSYDLQGNLLTTKLPDDQQLTYAYNAADRRISSTDSEGNTTTYSYDYQDNLIQEVDTLGGVQKYNYDKDNRLTKKIDAEGRYNVFFYDKGSKRLAKTIDGNLNEIDVTYRGFDNCGTCPKTFSNNPVRIKFPTFTRQFHYDLRGRMTQQSDVLDTTFYTEKYSYDAAGRLLTKTDSKGQQVSYHYNQTTGYLDGYLLKERAEDITGESVRFSYDTKGRLAGHTDETTSVITIISVPRKN